jgi:hypothetical protein
MGEPILYFARILGFGALFRFARYEQFSVALVIPRVGLLHYGAVPPVRHLLAPYSPLSGCFPESTYCGIARKKLHGQSTSYGAIHRFIAE